MAVTGNDGVVPIRNPESRWTTYALQEIYTGQQGAGKYVPKLNDYVVDYETHQWYKVIRLDETTWIAELDAIKTSVPDDEFSEKDRLLGAGSGIETETFRIFIDRSVIPYALTPDARLSFKASMASYIRIFKGDEINGKIISMMYDSAGNLLGDKVPLSLAYMPNGQNYTVKSIPTCSTTEELENNEYVTIVAYSDTGGVVSKRQMMVWNTGFIRAADASQKYITGISLETPFLSEADDTIILYPINVPLAGFQLVGVVHYSDGSTAKYPVDGTRFQVFGLEDYVATIVNQELGVVLKYNLTSNEVVYGSTVTNERFITRQFKAVTQNADGVYGVKLFGYPVWIDAVSGYRMEWFLLNLDRNAYYRCTQYVIFNENSPAFNPIQYGVNQRVSVSVNLKNVNGIFKNYIHTQVIDIVLVRPATDHTGTVWTIGYEVDQNPPFGRNNKADLTFINQNLRKVRIDQGETVLDTWLERMFYRTIPLYDAQVEAKAPKPDMFSLLIGNTELQFPISQWNQDLQITQSLLNNETLFIKFFKRTTETDLILSVSALPVWQIN